jgi:Tfp pilus assembly protein PilF
LRLAVSGAALGLALTLAAPAAAQSTTRVDTIAEARRLRDAGDYVAAASLLVPYVVNHPDDPGTARFAALMAYWSKDFSAARTVYQRAAELHPQDADLRVEYAQFLMGVGETSQARVVLTPLVAGPRTSPATRQALTTLGTLEYWRGDYSRARRLFIEKLTIDSTDAEARRQLGEIEMASAAWLAVGASGGHDDQPINQGGANVDGGFFLTPLTSVTVQAGSTRYEFANANEVVSRAGATIASFVPAARMDVSLGGGMLTRRFGDGSDWTARAALGFRLPAHVALQGSFERVPYLHTTASLTSTVMTDALDATLRWRAPGGWMADGTMRRESFEDDNTVTSASVWFLAPVAHRSRGSAHVGYSFSAQSAEESRFVQWGDVILPPGQLPETVGGEYRPYYTPRNLRVHSVLMAAMGRPSPRWSLSANGTLGVHARDDSPVLFVVPRGPNADIFRTYYRREFTPWNVRGAIEGAATESVRLALTAEHGKTAFYSFTTVGARFTYTFVAAARRRADRY